MPRTVQEILAHADELAARFEEYEPDSADEVPRPVLTVLRDAAMARSEVERAIAEIVFQARDEGHSWRSIGDLLGTSGEAARQRYGPKRASTTAADGVRPGSRRTPLPSA